MSHNIKYFLLYILILTITGGVSTARQEPNSPITLEAMPKITKGFPVIVKVNVEGPHTVSYTSIFDNKFCITVHLTSISDGKEYKINSYRSIGRGYLGGPRGGISREIIIGVPAIQIPKGQKYSMIFDVWSLSPRSSRDSLLDDIPAGKYRMFIEFLNVPAGERNFDNAPYTDKVNSNSIEIEFVEPNEQEKQFIQKIQDSASDLWIAKDKAAISWVKFLQDDMKIPNGEMSKLTQVVKDQLSLHKMILDVNLADEESIKKSIQDVNEASIPTFLEPEKQLLLLELKGNQAQDRERLLEKYPELRGMLEKFGSNYKPFTGYKEIRKQMIQYNGRSTEPKEPNL